MPQSDLFKMLKDRVGKIGTHLLPKIKRDLSYTDEEYDHVRAYILLVHSEIETFIEERILDEVKIRINKWELNHKPSVVLMGILAFHKGDWSSAIDSLDAPAQADENPTWKNRDTSTRLKMCRTQLHKLIKDNHGIKSANLLPCSYKLDSQ